MTLPAFKRAKPSFINYYLIVVLDSEFLTYVLWNGVLVYEEIHCLANDEVFRHVPNSLVIAGHTPRVLYHVVFSICLVLRNTENHHAVVVGKCPVVELVLTLFL